MKRFLLVLLIVLAGIGFLAYPFVSDCLSRKNGSFAIDTYKTQISEMEQTEMDAQWQRVVTYNENLSGNPVHDPFVEGRGMVMQNDYYQILNIGGTMGVVEIPKISVRLPIYHGTAAATLQKGLGHLEGSSLPIGGESTHSVITGHTGLTTAKMFTGLTSLREGDLFLIRVLDKTVAYKVDLITVTVPEDTEPLLRIAGADYCTLLTCTPYGVNSHRLMVRGVRTEYTPEDVEKIKPRTTASQANDMLWMAALVTACVMVVLIVIVFIVSRAHKKGKHQRRLWERDE